MSNETIRSYGVSKPVSLENPTASELLSSENLEETLRTHGYFESDIELTHRIDVMSKINDLAKKWIKNVSIEKNLPVEIAENVGGGVRTFGSYRLGVHSKGKEKQIEGKSSRKRLLLLFQVATSTRFSLLRLTSIEEIFLLHFSIYFVNKMKFEIYVQLPMLSFR